jgi:hypothetical protein
MALSTVPGEEARTMVSSQRQPAAPGGPGAAAKPRGVTPRPPVTPDRRERRPEGALLAGTSAQVRRVVVGGEKSEVCTCCDKDSAIIFSTGRLSDVNLP